MPKLCKWGNSLGLRVPAYVADCAHLKAGDQLSVRLLDSGDILVRPMKPRNGGGNAFAESAPPEVAPVKQEVW